MIIHAFADGYSIWIINICLMYIYRVYNNLFWIFHTKMKYRLQSMTIKKSLFLVKTSFCFIIFYFKINFNIKWLPYNIFIDLWYQRTQQIMEKDILNYITNCHVSWDTLYNHMVGQAASVISRFYSLLPEKNR